MLRSTSSRLGAVLSVGLLLSALAGVAPVSAAAPGANPAAARSGTRSILGTPDGGAVTVYGEPINLRAHVIARAPGAGTPTGTFQFVINGRKLGPPVALDAHGTATRIVRPLPVRRYSVNGRYSGDGSFLPSAPVPMYLVVKRGPTVTGASASPNPAAAGLPFVVHASVQLLGLAGGTLDGSVQFVVDGSPVGTHRTLSDGGAYITLRLAAGTHRIRARYVGSPNYSPSVSSAISEVVNPT